jgi:hypothetical protein
MQVSSMIRYQPEHVCISGAGCYSMPDMIASRNIISLDYVSSHCRCTHITLSVIFVIVVASILIHDEREESLNNCHENKCKMKG